MTEDNGGFPDIFSGATAQQAPDKTNQSPDVMKLFLDDLHTRYKVGVERYGVALKPHNGRDMLVDAYHEAIDLALYLRGEIYERYGR